MTSDYGKPNILLIFVDSARADHLSCYGYARPTSPNIDRVASEGCLFETCITAAPFSPASYASIISNQYPHQHGVNGDTVRAWPQEMVRLPQKLRSQGYFTFCVSNNSFVSRAMNGHLGFDEFVDPRTPWFLRVQNRIMSQCRKLGGAALADRLESRRLLAKDKGNSRDAVRTSQSILARNHRPFFGMVILMDPHALYDPSRLDFARDRRGARRFLRTINGRQMWARVMAGRTSLTREYTRLALDIYDAELLHADRCLGELVDFLDRTHQLEHTIVAVTSDHGEAFGEHGVWGHGFSLHECLTRVPLVLRHPGFWPSGSRFPGLVQLHDLHEMCLSVAESGDPRPDQYPHCLTQAANPDWSARHVTFSEMPVQSKTIRFMRELNPAFEPGVWSYHSWAVRSADWRYIQHDNGTQELYDLRADPGEACSLHSENRDVVATYSDMLARHRMSGATKAYEADESQERLILDRLRALGYVE
ncbi:MAG: sulfatase [Phycisphaerales bacterium]|nr:MAG: sulfatase [Phycisphaerales bacterium]